MQLESELRKKGPTVVSDTRPQILQGKSAEDLAKIEVDCLFRFYKFVFSGSNSQRKDIGRSGTAKQYFDSVSLISTLFYSILLCSQSRHTSNSISC